MAEVDLACEVYGLTHGAIVIMAISGGPGLSRADMLRDDVWPQEPLEF